MHHVICPYALSRFEHRHPNTEHILLKTKKTPCNCIYTKYIYWFTIFLHTLTQSIPLVLSNTALVTHLQCIKKKPLTTVINFIIKLVHPNQLYILKKFIDIDNDIDLGSVGKPGMSGWSKIGNLLIPRTLE